MSVFQKQRERISLHLVAQFGRRDQPTLYHIVMTLVMTALALCALIIIVAGAAIGLYCWLFYMLVEAVVNWALRTLWPSRFAGLGLVEAEKKAD